jgi:hypothetical protein
LVTLFKKTSCSVLSISSAPGTSATKSKILKSFEEDNLNKVSNVFDTLLREYSLSENGKLVFDTEKEIIVDEPIIVSVKSEPYTDQVEIVLFFQVVIDI